MLACAVAGAELCSGQWFWFEDASGSGWAQTDHLLLLPGTLVVFECKLTQHPHARAQLEGLYLPLVEWIWPERAIQLVEVFKNLIEPTRGREVHSLAEILRRPEHAEVRAWHWL